MGALARAEGVETRQDFPSTAARLHGVTTMRPMAGGGLISLGGSSLRVLAPRARGWETLHRQAGDNLYRVAVDDSGRVLAAWEKDPSIHFFTPSPKRHTTFARPEAPSPDIHRFHVDSLAFLPSGRDALVHMRGERVIIVEGKWKGSHPVNATYRVPLDGKSAPELLYQVEDALKLHITPKAAVYLLPRKPGQECSHRTCAPVAAIVAYEFTGDGVSRKTLLGSEQVPMSNARMIWGDDEDRVVLLLHLDGQERALLRWRPGDAEPGYRPFPKENYSREQLFVTRKDEVIELVKSGEELEIRRHPPEGGQEVTRLANRSDPESWDTNVHDLGERSDGSLWMHWGDSLLLLSPGKPPRGYDLEPLLTRRAEWAGAGIYLQEPESLWVGVEVGRGRDFVRLSFAEIEKRATPWPLKK